MGTDSKIEYSASEPGVTAEAKDSHIDDASAKGPEPVYPKGLQLTFIAVALALALFLIALDMVSSCPALSPSLIERSSD